MNEIKRLQQLAGIITEIKVNNPNIKDKDIISLYYLIYNKLEEISNGNFTPKDQEFISIISKYKPNFTDPEEENIYEIINDIGPKKYNLYSDLIEFNESLIN